MDPLPALRAHDWVVVSFSATDSIGILTKFLKDVKTNASDQELGFCVNMVPFILHASLPYLELQMQAPDEHQVISIKELHQHASAELTWKCFCHQEE